MKSQVKFPIVLYLGWYLIILLYQIFLQPYYILTSESQTLYQRLYWSWVSYWDSGHYVSIATQGYRFPQQNFFPLWPLTIKIASIFVGSSFIGAFILSIILGLTTFVLFYLLAEKLAGKSQARLALFLFAVFPSTFVLHAGYTEGLFLTLTLLSFLLMEKKLFFLSAFVGGLTNMTRMVGIGVAVTYLFLKQTILKRLILVAISLYGILFYILFLQLKFGNGLLFIEAHKAWCDSSGQCQLVFPLTPIIDYGRLVLTGWVKPDLSSTFIDWVAAVSFLSLLLVVWKKLNKIYFVYSLVVIILPLLSGSMVSMIRYVLVVFPVFFVFPKILRSKILFFILCLFLFLLELRFVTLFTNRIWVA